MTENKIGKITLDSAFAVHWELGLSYLRAFTRRSWRLSCCNVEF
jgi:hypothetical protein